MYIPFSYHPKFKKNVSTAQALAREINEENA
jgi:hypothetical protein